MNTSIVDVAIIGAGPYGLSVAAHLNAMGAPFPILDETQSVEEAYRAVRLGEPCVVVVRAGLPIAVFGASDLIEALDGDASR